MNENPSFNKEKQLYSHEHKLPIIGVTILASVVLAVLISAFISQRQIKSKVQQKVDSLNKTQDGITEQLDQCLDQINNQSKAIDTLKSDIYSVSRDSVTTNARIVGIESHLNAIQTNLNTRLSVIEKRHDHICEAVGNIQKQLKKHESYTEKQINELKKKDIQFRGTIDEINRKIEELQRRSGF